MKENIRINEQRIEDALKESEAAKAEAESLKKEFESMNKMLDQMENSSRITCQTPFIKSLVYHTC